MKISKKFEKKQDLINHLNSKFAMKGSISKIKTMKKVKYFRYDLCTPNKTLILSIECVFSNILGWYVCKWELPKSLEEIL